MPDVGILNLQIHDDSAKAAEGLSKLVTKLEEMKEATSKIRLGTVAAGIKRINDELSKVQPSAIYKLKQLADVLEKIGSISGNVGGIRISFGGRGQNAEDMAAQLQAARDAVAQTTAEFEQIGQRVQEDAQGAEAFANTMGRVNEIVQQTGWTAQATAEQFAQMFQVANSIRMSGALGGGASPFALGDGTSGSGADWTYWKDGAIEAEGTVTDAMESIRIGAGEATEAIRIGAGEAIPLLTGVVDSTSEIASSVQEMADSSEGFENTASEFDSVTQSVQQTADALRNYNDAIEFARKWNASGVSAGGYKGQESADIQYINNLIRTASQADLLAMRIDALRDKLYQVASSGKASGDQIARMVSQIQTLQGKLDAASGIANRLNSAFKRMFPTIYNLKERFKQLIKYRMLRSVIRHISEGFSEGVQNVYQYSKAVGTSLAPAMDAGATALQQMKNSIGAAAAPVIQALIPVLQTVVDRFIVLINYANQFFALINGQNTWTRALPEAAKAYENTAKNAKAAGKATKDLLADWDELNIIQSETSGAGYGAKKTAREYSQMFEEVSEYEGWIKSLGDILKNTFGDALNAAKLIGAAILGWKVSKAFGGILGKLGRIATGIVLEIIGVELAYNSGMDAGANGWNLGNIIGAVGGSLATALGGSLITSALGLSSGVGFAIGLGVGIVATLYGYIKGQQKAADAVKWGNLHLTAEEVKEYVRSQFAFDVTAEINALHTSITDMSGAKEEADAKIAEFEKTLKEAKVNISMGVNSDPNGTTVQQALTSAQEAVKSVQGLITSTNTGIEIGLKYLPMTDSKGNDISSQFLESVEVAETPLKDYLFGLGKDMAKAMYDGEAAGWDEGTMQAAIELMEKQKKIFDRAKELENDRKLSESVINSFTGVGKDGEIDRETAEAAYAEQKKLLDDWSTAAREQANEYADNLKELADLAQAAAEEEEKLGHVDVATGLYQSANDLRTKAKERLDQVENDIDAKLKETKEKIGDRWIEVFSAVYGEDVGNKVREMIAHTQYGDGGYYFGYVLDELAGAGHETEFGKVLKQGGTAEEVAKNLRALLQSATRGLGRTFGLEYQGPTFVDEILDEFVGNPLDLMDSDTKEQLKQRLIGLTNESYGTDVYNNLFGIHTEVPVEVEPVPEIVSATAQDSFDIETDIGSANEVPVEIIPVIDQNQLYQDIRQAVLDSDIADKINSLGMLVDLNNSGSLDVMQELKRKIDEYGVQQAFDMLDNYLRGNDWSLGRTRPIGMIASAGISDVGGGRYAPFNANPQPTEQDNQQQVNNTASGVERGVSNLYDALQAILRVAEAINRKEFTINIAPGSDWGQHNARSAKAYGRVTG